MPFRLLRFSKYPRIFPYLYAGEFFKFFFSKNKKYIHIRGYFENLISRNSTEYERFSSTEMSEYSFKESFSHYFCQVVALTHLLFHSEYFGESVCRSLVFRHIDSLARLHESVD